MTTPDTTLANLANIDVAASFVAIDFETADEGADSACAIGLVWVENGAVVRREYRLIKPPQRDFVFSHIHGITAADVENEPVFAEVWAELAPMLEGAEFFVAHNARFDQGVLAACCRAAGLAPPALPWVCTVALARQVWSPRSARLSVVCELLGIELDHHQALSDAEAAALIFLAAERQARVAAAA
jgi:DNA polymerase III subunit epsilon